MKPVYVLTLMVTYALLQACGGGGGGSSSAPEAPAVNTGVFVDSPVMGLHYESDTQSGLTNAAGEFSYRDGETVTFSVGGIELGSATGGEEITPLDLLGAEDMEEAIAQGVDDQLINILVFLQSLDRDHNSENGIDLGDLNTTLADASLDFDQPPELFQMSSFKQLVNENEGVYITGEQARRHFTESQGLSFITELPSQDTVDLDGEVDNVIQYFYDDNGRLDEIVEVPNTEADASEAATAITRLEYDTEGRLALLSYDDLENDLLLFTREYVYDNSGRLISLLETGTDDVFLQEESWQYDAVGNVLVYRYSAGYEGVALAHNPSQQSPYDLFFNLQGYNPNITVEAPLASIFIRAVPDYLPELAQVETVITSTYESDGTLASMEEYYEIVQGSENDGLLITSTNNTVYDHGKKVSSTNSGEVVSLIAEFQITSQTDITVNRTEAGVVTSCNIEHMFSGSVNQVSSLTLEHEPEDLVTYQCGETGYQERLVTRNEDGRVVAIAYIDHINSPEIVIEEQTIIYENDRVAEVAIEYVNGNTDNMGDIVVNTTTLASTAYGYTESGKLSSVGESTLLGLKTWTRDYRDVEIR